MNDPRGISIKLRVRLFRSFPKIILYRLSFGLLSECLSQFDVPPDTLLLTWRIESIVEPLVPVVDRDIGPPGHQHALHSRPFVQAAEDAVAGRRRRGKDLRGEHAAEEGGEGHFERERYSPKGDQGSDRPDEVKVLRIVHGGGSTACSSSA